MKWMIASDIHGSAYYARQMIAAFERSGADRLLLLGDLLYHGPRNALPQEYDPPQVIPMLNAYAERICCVRGNCDSEVDQMVLHFPIMAEYAVLPFGNRLIYATHGHHPVPPLQPGDILLTGHTHVTAHEPRAHYIYWNPGSISIPKEDTPRGYMLLEDGAFIWKTLSGEEWQRTPLGAPPTVKRVF